MFADHDAPIVAIATAPGRGAVGIVRISGKGLQAWAQQLCGRALRPRQATYLPLCDAQGEVIDQVLAMYFPAPHSYTGEDVVELHAHGGTVVLQLVMARCLAFAQAQHRPLRLAQPGEFTQRAYLNHKLDLAQAEAVADLIDASTEAAARSASRSLNGAFSHEVRQLQEALIHLRMLVEATLDFPEEEIDFLQQADAKGQLDRLQSQVERVLARTRQGALLREGIRVVIAGQPNAGKSSLLNALAGVELAIVTPIAGTTRDVVQQAIQLDGVTLHVIDTAGLREHTHIDEVERIGIQRAWSEIARADAVVFLHDLTRAHATDYAQADRAIEASVQEAVGPRVPVLHVWNKCDAASHDLPVGQRGLFLSAQTGEGLPAFKQHLLSAVGWQTGQAEGIYMARERHVHALQQVQSHLDVAAHQLKPSALALDLLAEELRLAQNHLSSITGAFTPDDLLGEIFSRFCIGK